MIANHSLVSLVVSITRNADRGLVESLTAAGVDYIAKAVEYVVNQPIEMNIEELVLRPQKSLF